MSPKTSESIVRTVLLSPIEQDHHSIAKSLGIRDEEVRKIRIGQLYPDTLPKLPRVEPEALGRRCTACLHFTQKKSRYIDVSETSLPKEAISPCTLGIPEAVYVHYARGCGAFACADLGGWGTPNLAKVRSSLGASHV
jgi:hypothetical protein